MFNKLKRLNSFTKTTNSSSNKFKCISIYVDMKEKTILNPFDKKSSSTQDKISFEFFSVHTKYKL